MRVDPTLAQPPLAERRAPLDAYRHRAAEKRSERVNATIAFLALLVVLLIVISLAVS